MYSYGSRLISKAKSRKGKVAQRNHNTLSATKANFVTKLYFVVQLLSP